jgi:hypothetical protein
MKVGTAEGGRSTPLTFNLNPSFETLFTLKPCVGMVLRGGGRGRGGVSVKKKEHSAAEHSATTRRPRNTHCVMSSSDIFFKIVVFPALSRPRTRIRASFSVFFSFRNNDSNPLRPGKREVRRGPTRRGGEHERWRREPARTYPTCRTATSSVVWLRYSHCRRIKGKWGKKSASHTVLLVIPFKFEAQLGSSSGARESELPPQSPHTAHPTIWAYKKENRYTHQYRPRSHSISKPASAPQ